MPLDSETRTENTGTLYVVGTPIGNFRDISIRAVDILKGVDCIAAEDTRQTGKLLAHLRIKNRLLSYHEHNEEARAVDLINRLCDGNDIALVSDAGTPGVSDPGYRLVNEAVKKDILVVPVPGPSACITALSASGLPTDMFAFMGFAPKKDGRRISWLTKVKDFPGTLIFYESPRRVLTALRDILTLMGDRDAVIARELTKTYETFIRGSITDLIRAVEEKGELKGEVTVLIAGKPKTAEITDKTIISALTVLLEDGEKMSKAVKMISKDMDIPKKRVYNIALSIKERL